jgi:hypothetical protein
LIERPALQLTASPSLEKRPFGVAGDAIGRQIFIGKFTRTMRPCPGKRNHFV